MTNEYPGRDQHGQGDGWQPLPQGDYDSDATAFVQLPPDGFPDEAPLAAPGHGYVPPQITVSPATGAAATDPAATGVWVLPPELTGAGGGDSNGNGNGNSTGAGDSGGRQVTWPAANQEPYGAAAAQTAQTAQGQTGQWSIPVADGELPEESGEFTTSALASQWGDRTPPATLPGGAPAPWATQEWAQPTAQEEPEPPAAAPEPVEPEPVVPEPVEQEVSAQAWTQEPAPAPADDEQPARTVEHREEPDQPVPPEPEPEQPESAAAATLSDDDRPAAAPATDTADTAAGGTVTDTDPDDTDPDNTATDTGVMADTDTDTDTGVVADAAPLHDDHPLVSYVLRVNGTDRPVTDAWIGESLLYVLRERLGLAGAKDGCSQGECGACNVQVDGRLVASCLVPAATTAGSEVRTVEGLAEDGQPSDVQRALGACGAVQCGFCIPGMAMTVHDLLEGNPDPSELETRQALCGNLCRCSGYRGVLDAVREVAAERRASATAAADAQSDEEPRIPHQAGPAHGELFQDGGQA
ncbi:(2Fe-2S)-binding protein [Streptomyces sp. VRA16 Mangrove soil]|uniref:(2Fe-2S)-binding protein n=1 Tax=Streptomyces sp. VRA16 Mangrove soil TaxID=2817434 RepID=UPI001A9EFA6A|nr:(2Fe-2S)-binding protein [Streptomyces sp. VRA16 Mangrove soil]MBO1337768.1 (2Fe-2S)-binding protein [Streptomyces sp. VRA16 Mangrove soil]